MKFVHLKFQSYILLGLLIDISIDIYSGLYFKSWVKEVLSPVAGTLCAVNGSFSSLIRKELLLATFMDEENEVDNLSSFLHKYLVWYKMFVSKFFDITYKIF